MKTWTKIRNPNVGIVDSGRAFKPGKLIAADAYGQPVETNTSLTDLGRRLVEARREARKTAETVEFVVAAQVNQNQSLLSYCQDLESRLNVHQDSVREEYDLMLANISQIEEDINSIKVVEDLRLVGKGVNTLKNRVILNEDARLKDMAALYNYVSNKVYLEKQERAAQGVEFSTAYRKLRNRFIWLTTAIATSYGLHFWSLIS
jgi:hypothetical protein